VEVTIERILPGGLGLAHAEGKTVMVSLAAPGDRLRVRVDREKGAVCFASIIEIIERSPHRIEPPCPYFGRCGGCDFQQMTYQAQLDAKVEIVKDCLHRIGKIENVPDLQITPAPNEWHYRSRAQWQYDADQKRLGYYESGSRRVCDVAECAVLVPELHTKLEELREQMHEGSLPRDARYFRAVLGDDGVAVSAGTGNPTVRDRAPGDIQRTINTETYSLDAESFFQTNEHLLPELIDSAVGDASGDIAVELYSGVGLFTLPLARRFKRVIAVEDNHDAARFARRNLANASLVNAEIKTADVATWLNLECGRRAQPRRRFGSERFLANRRENQDEIQSAVVAGALQIDLLLLDPPRTGAVSRVIDGILQLAPNRICYVSCDPATLARDLRKIIAGGYSLDSLAAFDMFPQTHHVETVAHLTGPQFYGRSPAGSHL
jgi:23S rRNA (uracil1939-C5)-methyltransferase